MFLEEQGIEAEFASFEDRFFENLDFECLFDDAYDGIKDSERGEQMGIVNLRFDDWFKLFGPPDSSGYPEVHPFAQDDERTSRTRPLGYATSSEPSVHRTSAARSLRL